MGEPARTQLVAARRLYLPRSPLLSGGGGGGGGAGAAHISVAAITEPSGQVCVGGAAMTGAGGAIGAATGTGARVGALKLYTRLASRLCEA